ncbi:MAG: dioxygenase [Ferrovum sp. 37-45-19]|nr:MAG: dioxygenase [Ferrovum sp. 21-44-67]OYV95071.1 MAG: dioxygenase [Ferrovum sp. 37-45-19]OZB31795.1 MAG: dioxygenase [Ferrovum sp. 34-44-207]
MLAITPSSHTTSWQHLGLSNLSPQAILCISAHWVSKTLAVTAMDKPRTIHDFTGFPEELYAQNYPAPGAPELAVELSKALAQFNCSLDYSWGLDHGSWAVLKYIYPQAVIPVLQLSLKQNEGLEFHFKLGQAISHLREKNILILASGNSVHNLYAANWAIHAKPDPRAVEFDHILLSILTRRDYHSFFNLFNDYPSLTKWAHPTLEHLLPLSVAFGASVVEDNLSVVCEGVDLSSISMMSLSWSS